MAHMGWPSRTGSVRRVDAWIALALLAPSLAQVLLAPIAARAVGVLVVVGSTVPVAWRRRRPAAAAAIGASFWLIPTHGFVYVGYVVAFLLFYSLAAYETSHRLVVLVVLYGVGVSLGASVIDGLVTGEYFGGVTSVLAPAIVGRLVRRQREQSRALQDLTRHLERERERAERSAVEEERARIARELHDVVAHGVSAIAVQSDAAEAALARDPTLVQAPLRAIRSSAADALGEMRRLVGILREDGESDSLAPLPGMGQLDQLIERTQAAGVSVTLDVVGEPVRLPAGLDVSAYRIVQEALTNVRKHAPGAAAAIRLVWSRERLELEVSNPLTQGHPARVDGGGHGMIGMRERVRIHGGSVSACADDHGRFVVEVVLPLEAHL